MIKENEKNEALDNIKYIKELIDQTRKGISSFNAAGIAIAWGIFCVVGFLGQRLFIPHNYWQGIWWTGLAGVTVFANYLIIKHKREAQSPRVVKYIMRQMCIFWIPLVLLAYTLMAFCLLHPAVSEMYIPIAIMLVISTGYLILAFMVETSMLFVGVTGYIGSILTAVFLLEYADIVFSILFGGGLILTGIFGNIKQKTREES